MGAAPADAGADHVTITAPSASATAFVTVGAPGKLAALALQSGCVPAQEPSTRQYTNAGSLEGA